MVDRKEVEALLTYVEMRLESDKVELPPAVDDETLAALCRAWLALESTQEEGRHVGWLVTALRLIESAKDRGHGIDYARGVAQSALREYGQESNNV